MGNGADSCPGTTGRINACVSFKRVMFATLNTRTSTVAFEAGIPKSWYAAYVLPIRDVSRMPERRPMLREALKGRVVLNGDIGFK
jgi:hypothetical protein